MKRESCHGQRRSSLTHENQQKSCTITSKTPHNIHNLADDPRYADVLKRLRQTHKTWVQETKDVGLIPEPIIEERRMKFGSEYAILRQREDAVEYNQRLGAIAAAASEGAGSLALTSGCDGRYR